jgi:hypothetical protein
VPIAASFESFEGELRRLVSKFQQGFDEFKKPGYVEAQLRDDFLNPFFSALGWDLENNAGLIQRHREVEIESRTGSGRADYLFRPERKPRFVCEAKKPAEELHSGYAMQAKRYAWTIGVRLAVLSDFEELKIYIVTGNPNKGKPDDGLWRSYSFREYITKAGEVWDLLARQSVAGGSIERAIESLPGALQPDRKRDFDVEFLEFLDGARRSLASDLMRQNDRADLLEGTRLNQAVQCILDRLLFIRISEARGIDMGTKLESLVETWKRRQERAEREDKLGEEPPAHWGGSGLGASRGSLWNAIVRHIRALDRRPPSHIPYFNGNLFKIHFSEELVVGDVWLSEFLEAIGSEMSPYKFGYVAVEILGTIYERFLGKIVRPHGRGAVIEEKPEVRKAGGVYYTPRYIVEYIVEQTVGKALAGKKPEETLRLRFLDPACGSGSFLIHVFERVCEHWQQWLNDNPKKRKRDWCWVDEKANTLYLTARTKRRILRETIYGIDLDPQAVEVTQLSLYLKMLEGETSETLQREHDLYGGDEPILPPLQDNIKCGNSLIASDFSVIPEDLVRVRAFDWNVGFRDIMKAGGFDAVVGNPPYILLQDDFRDDEQLAYFRQNYKGASYKLDTYHLFIERGIKLCRANGRLSFITPSNFLTNNHLETLRRFILQSIQPEEVVVVDGGVFPGVSVDNAVFVFSAGQGAAKLFPMTRAVAEPAGLRPIGGGKVDPARVLAERHALFTSGITHPASDLWDRLAAKWQPLGDFADVNFGKQLRDRAKFSRDVIAVAGRKAIPRTHVACVTGKDIERYVLNWSHLACLNDTIAQSGGCWDESKHGAKGKLLTRQIGRFPSFAFDDVGYHCLNTIFMVTVRDPKRIEPKCLLGIMNSKLFRVLWMGRFYDQRKTFPKIKGTYLKQMPIALDPDDKTRHDRLAGLVDKLLALIPSSLSDLEK